MITSNLHFRALISIAILYGLTSPLSAAPLTVVNPGFEDISGESPFNEFTFGELNGWQLYDPDTITSNGDGPTFYIGTLTPFEPDPIGNPGVYAYFPDGAAEGQRVGIAFNFEGSDGLGEYGFYQELTDTLQPHTTYTLEVEIGNIDSGTAMNGEFFPLEGFPGYRVELTAGGIMLEQDDNTLAGTIPDGEFATSTVTYTTGSSNPMFGQNLGIRLVNLNQLDPSYPNSDLEVDFDDVRLDGAPALDGDFDFSGTVDGLDYLTWQRGFPTLYDQSDYALWETNFGPPAPAVAIVPEPSTFVLATLVTISLSCLKRRHPIR